MSYCLKEKLYLIKSIIYSKKFFLIIKIFELGGILYFD